MPLREHGAEVHAVLPVGQRGGDEPHHAEQQGDHADRPDAEPENVEPDQQDPDEPERQRHARTLDQGLGADPLPRRESLVRRVDRRAGAAIGEGDVGDLLSTHQDEEHQRDGPDEVPDDHGRDQKDQHAERVGRQAEADPKRVSIHPPSVTTNSTLTTLMIEPNTPWNCASSLGSGNRAAARFHTM